MGEEIAAAVVLKSHSGKPAGRIQNPKQDGSWTSQDDTVSKIIKMGQTGKISGLSKYEAPKKIIIASSLPKTSTGKIQRVEVKKMVAEQTKQLSTQPYQLKQIEPTDFSVLEKAVDINNDRWIGLSSTLEEFRARATNGLFFGIFDRLNNLIGSLSCVQVKMKQLNNYKTWNEASGNGKLINHDPKGNVLVCVAISVRSNSSLSERSESKGKYNGKSSTGSDNKFNQLAKQKIADYVHSGKDYVLAFHHKPKSGLSGASVWKILENGRTDDTESMGYNVLMRYPVIKKNTKIVRTKGANPSVMLIEHTLLLAKGHGVRNVIAFSRPSGFRRYLASLQG
jgi:hypothetical protein